MTYKRPRVVVGTDFRKWAIGGEYFSTENGDFLQVSILCINIIIVLKRRGITAE